ncbi:MAG: divergent PAP2 family protein [Bacilli bacterium]
MIGDFKYIIIPVVSVILTQIIKFTIESVISKKLRWARLFNGNGGMPSSHTAFTFSLAFAIGIGEGFNSPLFAMNLIFACIVGYDAMGLRMESGLQAQAINLLTEEMIEDNPKLGVKRLQEQLGHKPLEVIMGILLGGVVATIMMLLIG